jgi:hypothetical protein
MTASWHNIYAHTERGAEQPPRLNETKASAGGQGIRWRRHRFKCYKVLAARGIHLRIPITLEKLQSDLSASSGNRELGVVLKYDEAIVEIAIAQARVKFSKWHLLSVRKLSGIE